MLAFLACFFSPFSYFPEQKQKKEKKKKAVANEN